MEGVSLVEQSGRRTRDRIGTGFRTAVIVSLVIIGAAIVAFGVISIIALVRSNSALGITSTDMTNVTDNGPSINTILAGLGISAVITGHKEYTITNTARDGGSDINTLSASTPLLASRTGNTVALSTSFKPCAVNTCAPSARTCTRVRCVQISAGDNACIEDPLPGCTPRVLMPYETCNLEGQCSVKGEAADISYPTWRQVTPSALQLLDTLFLLNTSFYANDQSIRVSVPATSWTASVGDFYSAVQNQPFRTVQPFLLSGNEFAEIIISSSLHMYWSCAHMQQLLDGADNTLQASPRVDPQCAQVFAELEKLTIAIGKTIVNATGAATINGKPIDFNRILGLRLVADNFHNLKNWWGNDKLQNDKTDGSVYYFGSIHRYLSSIYHAGRLRLPSYSWEAFNSFCAAMQYWAREEQGGYPLSLLGDTWAPRTSLCPHIAQVSAAFYDKYARDEEYATGKYWTPIYFSPLFTNISKIFVDATDPEGQVRDPDQTPLTWVDTTVFIDYLHEPTPGKPDNSFYANFTLQNVTGPDGITSNFRYRSNPNEDILFYDPSEYLERVYEGTPGEAQRQLAKIAYAHDLKLIPARRRFGAAIVNRWENQDNMANDHYTGGWRSKIRYVASVQRNHVSLVAISFDTPCTIGGTSAPYLRVPFSPTLNALYAANNTCALSSSAAQARFSTYQADMAEMDLWNLHDLENTVNAHDGDTYLYLSKFDTTKGIIPSNNPYADVPSILANYKSVQATVQPFGQPGDLVDVVRTSGTKLIDFFKDIQEFLGDKLVKEEYEVWNFSSSATAGIGKVNLNGTLITREIVNAIRGDENSGAKSDLECLGRHYGRTVTGAVNSSEPFTPTTPGGTYRYSSCMDYVYRQHYAIDTTQPLTPSNNKDPVTNKMYYQYTDPGDTARYNSFRNQFTNTETDRIVRLRNNRPGTYNRWKHDWILQKLAMYVVNTALDKGLMLQDFANRYYLSTMIDTNNATTLTYTGPNSAYGFGRRVYRIRGTLSGGQTSSTSQDPLTGWVNTTITWPTFIPLRPLNGIGLMLHEGALGHGFDTTPVLIDQIRGIARDVAWPANGNAMADETHATAFFYPVPANGALFEGWATFGEILGIINQYAVKFDDAGLPIPNTLDYRGALVSMISLSRIATRQVSATSIQFSRYAFSFNRLVNEFKANTGFTVPSMVDFINRFHQMPMQQTSYAAGFINNIALVNYLTDALAAQNKTFSMARFVQFRITRTDYIIGASLLEIATQDIYQFATDAPVTPLSIASAVSISGQQKLRAQYTKALSASSANLAQLEDDDPDSIKLHIIQTSKYASLFQRDSDGDRLP